jgi:hypothetical protein
MATPVAQDLDPCIDALNMSDYNRNPFYIPDPVNDVNLCDISIKITGWIRFDSLGQEYKEEKITETCPKPFRCGTQSPIWVNDKHPMSDSPGPKNITVCARTNATQCCGWSSVIQVKWCSPGYYVYKLKRPPRCDMAYCFSDPTGPLPNVTSASLDWTDNGSSLQCSVTSYSDDRAVYEYTFIFDDGAFSTQPIQTKDTTATMPVSSVNNYDRYQKIECAITYFWKFSPTITGNIPAPPIRTSTKPTSPTSGITSSSVHKSITISRNSAISTASSSSSLEPHPPFPKYAIVIVSLGGVALVLGVGLFLYCVICRKHRPKEKKDQPSRTYEHIAAYDPYRRPALPVYEILTPETPPPSYNSSIGQSTNTYEPIFASTISSGTRMTRMSYSN